MVRFSAIILLLLAFMATQARSGQETPPRERQEFKQSKTYPYVFVPVGYLSNGGPLPLLFGPAASDCENRNPPPLPKNTKKETPAAAAETGPSPTPAISAPQTPTPAAPSPSPIPVAPPPASEQPAPANPEMPAYPPPDVQTLPQGDSLDLNKYPAEVIGIFKNPYTVPKSRQHFFDPVFEPPPPQAPQTPSSSATYRQQ